MTPADKLFAWLHQEQVNVMRSIFHGYEPQAVLFDDPANTGEDRSLDEGWLIYPSDLPLQYASDDNMIAGIDIDTCGKIYYAQFPDITIERREGKYEASIDWEIVRDAIKKVLEG